jgi:hypothetical protein
MTLTYIDREHREFLLGKRLWQRYNDLYEGGEQLKEHAEQFLVRRQKEPQDVYFERLGRLFYENYVGSIIGWYGATVFRREPTISFETPVERVRQFYSMFSDNCDGKSTRLCDLVKQVFTETLVYGKAHVLVDFPASPAKVSTRAEEEALDLSTPLLVSYPPSAMTNWSKDSKGKYDWIVIRETNVKQPDVTNPELVTETVWRYFDRREFRIYRRVKSGEAYGPIEIVRQGKHCLAQLGKVPVVTMTVTPGLWLMNKAALLQIEHLNKLNALGWAITMGLFAMPVIYSDREWNQMVGESYYIQLGPQDRFGWTEPDGKVFDIAARNLASLKDEIYRICYLTQAAGDLAGVRQASALSKIRDFALTQEVLRSYGDVVKSCLRDILTKVAEARQDDVSVLVTGLDEFDIGDFAEELADAQQLLTLGIESPTFKKNPLQKLALKSLAEVRQDIKDQISLEIQQQFTETGGK